MEFVDHIYGAYCRMCVDFPTALPYNHNNRSTKKEEI